MTSPSQLPVPPPPTPPDFWELVGVWLTTGNAPGWFAVIVAGTAAGFALRSSRASRRSADTAQKQLERLEAADERALADAFSVWGTRLERVRPTPRIPKDRTPAEPPTPVLIEGFYRTDFEIDNSGEAVVTGAFFYVPGLKNDEPQYLLARMARIPPRNRGTQKWWAYFAAREILEVRELPIGVIFTDGRRRAWDRAPTGVLTRIDDDEAATRISAMMSLQAKIMDEIDWKGFDGEFRGREGLPNPQ